MRSCSIEFTRSRHATDQWFYSSSSTCSSVSGTYPDLFGYEDYGAVQATKGCEDLYPLTEVMDGKEVVTITTSNTVHTTNTLSVAVPGSESHISMPCKGMQTMSSRDIENNSGMKCIPQTCECNGASNTKESLDSFLMTPGAFLSETCSTDSGNIPERLSPSSTPIRSTYIYENPDVSTKVDSTYTCSRQDFKMASSQMSQLDYKVLNTKESLKQLNVLLTPKRFTHAQDTESSNGNTSCGAEVDLISNMDDFEQDLKTVEQLEDDQKEAEGQPCQKSLYDVGRLPPIGVFWDIENCQVPKGLSATHVVQAIRTRFFNNHREVEFMCVCDTLKENSTILEELNDAQVNVMHVGSFVKNAADDKLLQSMRRFADIHGHGATIVLISGDSNFATELYDLRYRKNLRVILVHNAHAQDSLKLSAHETALFTEVTEQLPQRTVKPKSNFLRKDVLVRNLPKGMEESAVRRRLNILSANCGGKVGRMSANCATIYFQTPELAARAKKRLDGEDVFGSRICCSFGKNIEKESSRIDASGKCVHEFTHDRELELPENLETNKNLGFDSLPQQTMGEVAAPGLSWRMHDTSANGATMHQPFSAFKTYGKSPSISIPTDDQRNVQRSWQSNTHRMPGNPKVGIGGNFTGLQNGGGTEENCGGSQAIYLDRLPDNYHKGHFQKPSFRMSSPPVFSFCHRNSDSYLNNTSRGRSPSPQTVRGVGSLRNTWNTPLATNIQERLCSGLQEISIEASRAGLNLGNAEQVPVELQVANLDQNIDAREMKRILFTVFRDHVMVLHISVFVQSDGNLVASVRVPSQQDAQYAISQLHRKKIGAKRIIISYVNHNQPSPEVKRSKVIMLLQEVPGKRLPLFKFRELYERRFRETIGVSEMYNMRDIVTVSDSSTGRMVMLHPEFRHLQSPDLPEVMEETDGNCSRFCKLHSSEPDESIGWAERDHNTSLPNVNLSLRTLAAAIHALLQSHSGFLPLASLLECHHAELGPLEEYEGGVPLEHLISCLPGICIAIGAGEFKYIKWVENKVIDEADELARSVSPPLVDQLALFSRELVDLFKTFPYCRLPFSRFIPAYHHHFGRQCRVADYGFTKLADLFEALPHIMQILGEGNKRILTLAHKAQVKRFSSDLLRVLKGQPTKAITLQNFPSAYEKIVNRQWNVVDYGVCDIEDLLAEVCENTVIVSRSGTEVTVGIPKREQTPEEIERTRQFAAEVIELLRHSPQCLMQFNRFIPAYHHHFGRQCRVADFGFSKLIELFEAIPDIVQAYDDDDEGEKQLQLVERERIRVLGEQVGTVVKGAPCQAIKISALTRVFTRYYGCSLKPSQYESNSLPELIGKLRNHVKLIETEDEPLVALVDRSHIHEIIVRSRKILWDIPEGGCKLDKFMETYREQYNASPSLEIIKKDLGDILNSLGDLMTVRGRGSKRILVLNQDTVPAQPFISVATNSCSAYGGNADRVAVSNAPSHHAPAPQLPLPHTVPTTANYEYQHLMQATGGSMIWGQMWSPQYPVMPPLSPAHYMVPTIPVSWGGVPASPLGAVTSDGTQTLQSNMTPQPVSIHTLDELTNQGSRVSEAFTSPPNACELPTPDLFTHMHPTDIPHGGTVGYIEGQQESPCREDGTSTQWTAGNEDAKLEMTSTSVVAKPHTKRRIAAQFTSSHMQQVNGPADWLWGQYCSVQCAFRRSVTSSSTVIYGCINTYAFILYPNI
ncbi:Meiosis regulator and mRNA stability factor 1 [Chionoecetes opilio]|uniref:Meiosis regulator and mRNA stability factor 1 n=1 Tax=Chionoecetes opilio TaxID=41210 RepID=A0A8J4Y1P7_CHIOP|nr:Meiosis regulator and mRNA stability factor 1 [Chionoecetes opilio]